MKSAFSYRPTVPLGVDPEELYAMDVPYDVELTWSKQGSTDTTRFSAIAPRLHCRPARPSITPHSNRRPWNEYTNGVVQ